MDYNEVRRREKMKKRGIKVSGGELKKPVRKSNEKRRSIILITILVIVTIALGAAIMKINNIEFSILPAPPTAEPNEYNNVSDMAEELTDGSGNALPTVEPPNTYELD